MLLPAKCFRLAASRSSGGGAKGSLGMWSKSGRNKESCEEQQVYSKKVFVVLISIYFKYKSWN